MGTNRRLTGVLGAVLGGILVLGGASSANAVPVTFFYGTDAAGHATLTVTGEALDLAEVLVQFNQEIGGPVAPTGSITVALRCVEGSWLFGDGSTREIVVESIQFISGDGIESYDLDPALCSVAVTEPETPVEPIDTPAIEAPMPPAATSAVPAAPPELAETGFGGSSTGLCALTLLAIGGALSVSRLLPVSAAHRMRAQRASV